MTQQLCKSVEMIGFFLTPEYSAKHDQHLIASNHRKSSGKRLVGYAKSAVWILVSIILSLAIGQLT